MWEAIDSNQRRSWALISVLGAVLVALGFIIGIAVDPGGGAVGAVVALGIWLILLALAFGGGDQVLLLSAGARKIRKADSPRLWNVVEEMSIASGFGRVPDIYIVDDDTPNAFAVGRRTDRAAVAVTSGLLSRLNRDELQGVIAHEMAHIVNRDVQFMTIAGVMVGAIVILSQFFLRFMWFGGTAGRRRSSGGDPRVQAAILAVAILVAILAPLFARLLYFACSRRREYLADASGARFTRYPEGLASALEKISRRVHPSRETNRALAPMYIVNPLQAYGGTGLFSTHPPVSKRVKILRNMAGAGYGDYEAAYRDVFGGEDRCIGMRTLSNEKKGVPIRDAFVEPKPKKDAVDRAREVSNLLDRLGGYLLLTCACGVGIKVPPESKRDSVSCPRCGRANELPAAVAAAAAVMGAVKTSTSSSKKKEPDQPFRYERRGQGWETFKCPCGRVVQLSPSHAAPTIRCRRCRREIDIVTSQNAGAR